MKRVALALGLLLVVGLLVVPRPPGALLGAAHQTLTVGLVSSALGTVVGALFGVVARMLGSTLSRVLGRWTAIAFAVPIVVAVPLLAASLTSTVALITALAVIRAGAAFNVVMREADALAAEPFTLAARALGASKAYLVRAYLAPRLLRPLLACMALGSASAVGIEATLAFLGLSNGGPSLGMEIAARFAEGARGPMIAATAVTGGLVLALLGLAEFFTRTLHSHEVGLLEKPCPFPS